MRRADRMIADIAEVFGIFDKAPYITVSFTRPDGTPYGVPLSLARRDESAFYFHCAGEGEKMECIAANPIVALSAVTRCRPFAPEEEPANFTVEYRSAMAVGRASIVADEEEKIGALRAICTRFLPGNMHNFDAAIAKSLDRTVVVKITLTEPPVGKRRER